MTFSLMLGMAMFVLSPGQQPCGNPLIGSVQDTSNALLPGAKITLDGTRTAVSGEDGTFEFSCVASGRHSLSVLASSFAASVRNVTMPVNSPVVVKLNPEVVETTINVDGKDATPSSSGGTRIIAGTRLQSLADDPDDLLRQLKQLASSTGANPSNITVAIDGFQDSTTVPAKSSIQSITIDPDLYSAEYGQPPYNGGRVEIRTKPGQSAVHGSLLLVNGSPFANARDPFSTSKAPIGKQRYGGEMTGPIRSKGSDFLLGLEYRRIDNFAVVDAVTLDALGKAQSNAVNVATPERLWQSTARLDWQLGSKNVGVLSFTGANNDLQNVGVGGLSLPESGYASRKYDNVLRLSDFATLDAKRLFEARLSVRWDGESDAANASTPQVAVAGSFIGGGSTLGNQQLHEVRVESDDDALFLVGHHALKIGIQMLATHESDRLTTGMNGLYLFGGGTAPVLGTNDQPIAGETETINGLEQYRRSVLALPGGTPTSYQVVSGSPNLSFTQWSEAVYAQDEWSATERLHLSLGLRYYAQTSPTFLSAITPRLGFTWSPNPRTRWTIHGHAGLFGNTFTPAQETETLRLNGRDRVSSTIYNPTIGHPFVNAVPVTTIRSLSSTFTTGLNTTENVGGSYDLPCGWQLSADLSFGRIRNADRSVNINSPSDGSPLGLRPGLANTNVLQEQNSGKGRLDIEYLGFSQQTHKWAQVFFGGVRIHRVDDLATPQDSRTNLGEFARSDNQPVFQISGNALLTLPKAIEWSTDLYGGGGIPYNIVTGSDNNGDGTFNDRPRFAMASQPGAISTPYGFLANSGNGLSLSRNRGTIPPSVHVDMNIQHRFVLSRSMRDGSERTATLNIRSANVLNHTNVTNVGNFLGTSLFRVPYAADAGRRIEVGLRYSF